MTDPYISIRNIDYNKYIKDFEIDNIVVETKDGLILIELYGGVKMNTIVIKDIVNQCATKDAGLTLYKQLQSILTESADITLDFKDMDKFSHTFFNTSVGALIIKTKDENITSKIKLINLSETGQLIYSHSVENAKILLKSIKAKDI